MGRETQEVLLAIQEPSELLVTLPDAIFRLRTQENSLAKQLHLPQ